VRIIADAPDDPGAFDYGAPMRFLFLACVFVLACAPANPPRPAAPMTSAKAPVKPGAQVMILGLYHFHNPGRDIVKGPPDDHLSPQRQADIADVIARLVRFAPTKILVEAVDQAALTAKFEAGGPLDSSELEQLGFRLARQLKLPGLIAIDHKLDMDFDRLLGAANASKDQVFLDTFHQAIARIQADTDARPTRTVRASLIAMNDPARIDADRQLYLAMARVKHGDDFAGPDVLAGWYQRNFRIFANLVRAVTSPDDRVLVIYGQGHAAILRELVAANPGLVLVEPNAYLAGD